MYSQRNQPNLNVPNVINSGISLIPYFEPSMPQNVTALVGKSAYLSCKVRNLGNKTVSIISLFIDFQVPFVLLPLIRVLQRVIQLQL